MLPEGMQRSASTCQHAGDADVLCIMDRPPRLPVPLCCQALVAVACPWRCMQGGAHLLQEGWRRPQQAQHQKQLPHLWAPRALALRCPDPTDHLHATHSSMLPLKAPSCEFGYASAAACLPRSKLTRQVGQDIIIMVVHLDL